MQLELQGRISRLHQGKDPGLWGGTVQSQGREGPSVWERRREEPCERGTKWERLGSLAAAGVEAGRAASRSEKARIWILRKGLQLCAHLGLA